MNLNPVPDQSEIEGSATPLPFPIMWGRVLYGLFVTILPAFSFWATELLKPEWQTGKLQDGYGLFAFEALGMAGRIYFESHCSRNRYGFQKDLYIHIGQVVITLPVVLKQGSRSKKRI